MGLSCKENTWNEFQKDHTGIFSNTKDAASAYKELKTSPAPSPWPYGYDTASNIREMKVGETFRMVVDDNKEDTPGRFATCDAVLDAQYGRQQLAIKEAWKPTLDNVVTYKVKKPFLVYEGPVGPQIEGGKYLQGGGTQITFVDKADWAQARPNTYNNYTDSPLLEVESIRKLS